MWLAGCGGAWDEALDVPLAGLPAKAGPIEPLAYADLAQQLRYSLRARVKRLGYLGGFFGFAGHQPRALYYFHLFTEELKDRLPDGLTETVALATAALLGNDYERVQHERLAHKKGKTSRWIAAAAHGQPEGELSEPQEAARALAVGMVARGGHDVQQELRRLVDVTSEETAVGVLLLVGRYVAHGHVANALELTVPEAADGS